MKRKKNQSWEKSLNGNFLLIKNRAQAGYADCGLNGGNSGKSFTPIIKTMIPMILTGNAENRNTPDLSLGH
ncbi:MAG: hypothetical protein ACREBU_18350, partial [Nitrososphaera sp.]